MENPTNNSISRLYKELKSRAEVRALIPMGYVAGLPVITVKNEQLVAIIPFLRYKATGEIDRTLVFPIRYILEYLVPECQLVGFKDLAIEPGYADFDFEKVAGFFRHEAVKHMDRAQYAVFKQDVLARLDRLVDFLIGENEEYSMNEDKALASDLQTIIEPFIIGQYASLDGDYYNKYLKK